MTLPQEARIWRFDAPFIDSLVLIGNGCVVNGWQPLINEFKDEDLLYIEDPILPLILRANTGRHSINALTAYLQKGNKIDLDGNIHMLLELDALRKRVGDIYSRVSTTIPEDFNFLKLNLSEDLYELMRKNTTLTITTNWDPLLWDDNSVKNLIQLHGLAGSGDISLSMVLPTEMKRDWQQFYFLNSKKINENREFDEIKKNLKYRACVLWDAEMKLREFIAEQGLNIKRIVISGVKFNNYDSELMELLYQMQSDLNKKISTNDRQKLEEIEIINPNGKHANRAALLLHGISKRVIQRHETTRIIHEDP